MDRQAIILLDNGSRRAEATLSLRKLAQSLEDAVGETIYPVSLQHANHIDPGLVEGRPALIFETFLRDQLQYGQRKFLVLPLFFGRSRALTSFIPDVVSGLQEDFGHFELVLADVLCPLPDGEQRLAQILCDNVEATRDKNKMTESQVILVDHGSPTREVAAVREKLASQMRDILGPGVSLHEAVMERRPGREYDFTGRLLEEVLDEFAKSEADSSVILSMLFLAPGRHAGSGGDIATIRDQVVAKNPGLQAAITPLVAEHSGLVSILRERLEQAL